MVLFNLHRRIPLVRRPYYQRDQMAKERDTATAQLALVRRSAAAAASARPMVANLPSIDPPSHQNAVDLFRGAWVAEMPQGSGLSAGAGAGHFTDSRVTWAANVLGGLAGKTVLELGPFEAYCTYMLESLGAEPLTSIDNSPANFLKCLIVKNVFGLRSTFFLGDFVQFVETTQRKFDICWASGILYHMTEPLRLLEGMARTSDVMFIWSQYFDEAKLSANADANRYFNRARDQTVRFAGRSIVLHHRNYITSDVDRASNLYAGGPDEYSLWMELSDIKFVLGELGFSRIEMGVDNPDHPPGQACSFLAFRS